VSDQPSELQEWVARGARLVGLPTAAQRGVPISAPYRLAQRAIAEPLGSPPLSELVSARSRVTVVVSDATRDEPREELFAAAREAMPQVADAQITLIVASGTHAPRDPRTALTDELCRRYRVVVHDGTDESACVEVGTTSRGTRVRLNRWVVDTDLVVSLGRVRPHYFAGYSGGVKGVFPGCAFGVDIRQNHLFKADPSARLGRVSDNVCRSDMEDAAALAGVPMFLVNVIADCDHAAVDAVAGDIVAAHRVAAARSERWFQVSAPRARVIITTDRAPVTSSLYQAAKCLPPAGALLHEGGVAILVARCEEGTGPIEVVNRGIYELGVRRAMPGQHTVRLVSDLTPEVAATTFARAATSVDAALADAGYSTKDSLEGVLVLWRAGEMIARADAT
jgi:nickel-dependent lactate racemase